MDVTQPDLSLPEQSSLIKYHSAPLFIPVPINIQGSDSPMATRHLVNSVSQTYWLIAIPSLTQIHRFGKCNP